MLKILIKLVKNNDVAELYAINYKKLFLLKNMKTYLKLIKKKY